LSSIPPGSKVLIDVSKSDFIDHDIAEIIDDFTVNAPLNNIRIEFKETANGMESLFSHHFIKTKENA
ncbi:MAG: SulP family inorganic anion transporter, partial [Crocinitomicaceae bacterium]|nr:SulP family inorganic anion transporter [Crocinitomicaceae bacterium]